MKNKKMTVKRLVIFVILSFLPFMIMMPIINHMIGTKLFVANEYAAITYAVGVIGMLIPSVAHILTRLITKEGFDDLYMQLNIKGNVRYYVASILVKLVEALVYIFLLWRVFIPEFKFTDIFCGNKSGTAPAVFMIQMSGTLVLIVSFFGEEWGWRGYMMPKLLEITSKPVAIIVGGVIWGLWHAPLTMSGHNFGVDYPGFPYLGILFMCLDCICFNAFLTLLTERTKSILPASICHGINNNMGAMILFSLLASQSVVLKVSTIGVMKLALLQLPTILILGIVSMILFCRKKDNES